MDEIAAILSYTSKWARESREWAALHPILSRILSQVKWIYSIHEKAGLPVPGEISSSVSRILEAVRSKDLSKAAGEASLLSGKVERVAAAYQAAYRTIYLIILGPSLIGIVFSIYFALQVDSGLVWLLAFSAAGLLASTIIAPPRYSHLSLVASSILLALSYLYSTISGHSNSPAPMLYSIILLASAVTVGAVRGGIASAARLD